MTLKLVDINPDIWNEVKVLAAKKRTTISKLVEEFIKKGLEKNGNIKE